MADCAIVPVPYIWLKDEAGVLRDYTRSPEHLNPVYLDQYDRNTLIYDCVWQPALNRHVINAPLLLNLWAPFKDSLRRDGAPVPGIKRKVWKRSEQITIPGPPGAMQVRIGEETYPLIARASQTDRFKGLNCLVALNKDNHLEWVRDWARYYVQRHGAEGVVLIDNGSTAYPLEDLAATLAGVEGLKQAVIYSVPLPYGSMGGRRRRGEKGAKFLQSAVLNMARSDALAQARAVLSVDIDEIVTGPEPETIFDAAVRNPMGMITFKGFWGYPESADLVPIGHGAHRFRSEPSPKCNRKWCIAPGGLIGRLFPWDVHQVGGILQNVFTEQTRFTHIHCRGCSTGWKNKRFEFPGGLVPDPELAALMDRYFKDPT
ncbi:hypothetical protein [Pseudoruegeria sp. SK021]|uniref:hypothetical protein n=1 Tax=Pseudoruegeria sp. SK021 TaxID=1933035 RepID=UPI000A25B587|nr:hypothetical protein [Pseudoruegeria sp. SK021]OSP53517.1 hypothetical protein BV911_17590 [Pseudoruegeria sp. SK021]